MAIDLCSENSGVFMGPRISFSHDFCHTEPVAVEQHSIQSDSSDFESSIDFDFCVRESFDQESSSADELFSDGKIRPVQIKRKAAPPKQRSRSNSSQPPPPPQPPPAERSNVRIENSKSESMKEIGSVINDSEEKQNSKSFWRFNRSSSLNCGSGYRRSLCPLPLLSRSNSTGSSPTVKRSAVSKDGLSHKHNPLRHSAHLKSSSQSSSSTHYRKPPLKKMYGSGNSSVRINPILNVAPPSLFGWGSIFNGGKDKNRKK